MKKVKEEEHKLCSVKKIRDWGTTRIKEEMHAYWRDEKLGWAVCDDYVLEVHMTARCLRCTWRLGVRRGHDKGGKINVGWVMCSMNERGDRVWGDEQTREKKETEMGWICKVWNMVFYWYYPLSFFTCRPIMCRVWWFNITKQYMCMCSRVRACVCRERECMRIKNAFILAKFK